MMQLPNVAPRNNRPMRSRIRGLLVSVTMVAATVVLGASSGIAVELSFQGSWDTKTDKNWDYKMDLVEQGDQVSGGYVAAQDGSHGQINGIVKDGVLRFNWVQGEFRGKGQFALSADGNSFSGVYQAEDNPKLGANFLTGKWTGVRHVDLGSGGVDFSGSWLSQTDKGWTYRFIVAQEGNSVTGTYEAFDTADHAQGTGSIRGKVEGRVLKFKWQQGEFHGTGEFSLDDSGRAFTGVYAADPNPKLAPEFLQGTWSGRKRGP
jgi:hypothetical protein